MLTHFLTAARHAADWTALGVSIIAICGFLQAPISVLAGIVSIAWIVFQFVNYLRNKKG